MLDLIKEHISLILLASASQMTANLNRFILGVRNKGSKEKLHRWAR